MKSHSKCQSIHRERHESPRLSSGISKAMIDWGDLLLSKYGKDRQGVECDFTLNYLGYSTDK